MNDLYDVLNGLGIYDSVVVTTARQQIAKCNYFIIPVWLVVFVYEPEFRNDFYIVNNSIREVDLCAMSRDGFSSVSLWHCENFRSADKLVELVQQDRANITKMLLC